MYPIAPLVWIALYASQRGKQPRVPRQVERALERLDLDHCIDEANRACAGLSPDDLTVDVISARKGFAQALKGLPVQAAETLDAVRVDALPPEERYRFFSGRILFWLLAHRTDAARDVLEVDIPRIQRMFVLPPVRERLRLALAALRAAEGEGAAERRTLETIATRGWRPLHQVLAHIFVARLDLEQGVPRAAIAHLEMAAALGPQTVARSLLQKTSAHLAPLVSSDLQGENERFT